MACNHTHVSTSLLTSAVVAAALTRDPTFVVLLAFTGSGAGLPADLDIETSSATNAAGPLLAIPLMGFRKLMIMHRGLTHTLLAVLVVTGGVYALSLVHYPSSPWLVQFPLRLLLPAAMCALAVRAVMTIARKKSTHDAGETRPLLSKQLRTTVGFLVAFAAALAGHTLGTRPHYALFMALIIGTGWLTHELVDAAMGGVPLWWPLKRPIRSFSASRTVIARIKTNSKTDHIIGYVSLVLALVVIALVMAPALHHLHVPAVPPIHLPTTAPTLPHAGGTP